MEAYLAQSNYFMPLDYVFNSLKQGYQKADITEDVNEKQIVVKYNNKLLKNL